jgi:hypothetical protein
VARARRNGLVLTVAAAFCLAAASGTAWGTSAELVGGQASFWEATDQQTTSNGRPAFGSCMGGPGDAITNAGLEQTEQGDAFDSGAMVWVDNTLDVGRPTQIAGAGAYTDRDAVFEPFMVAGLRVEMKYRALSTQATLRTLVRFSNPTDDVMTPVVEYVNNFGSDASTLTTGDSNGSGGYDAQDRWIVTDDDNSPTPAGDPANTTVFFGPGNPAEPASGFSALVFECAGTQGSNDAFMLEIPPGAVETLMFFQQLSPTSAEANANASQFNTTLAFGGPLTEGMTLDEYNTLVNWDTGAPPPECSDGIDNDGDDWVDFPADPECASAADASEHPHCSDGLDNDIDGATDYGADLQCDSPSDTSELAQCEDGLDNDDDGAPDFPADPGCSSPLDNREAPNPRCSDGVDNDGDGAADYPADTGCRSVRDSSEAPNPACSDGVDNDGDGAADYPADPGCRSVRDTSEGPNPACSDGVDNDGDGAADHPADPGCSSPRDNKESPNPQCSDGVENDGDGRTDYPDDPGCRSARDNSEDSDSPPG